MLLRTALASALMFACANQAMALTPLVAVTHLVASAQTTVPATPPAPGDQKSTDDCKNSEECEPGTPYTGNDPPAPSDAIQEESDSKNKDDSAR
jgi:hypothetical protein